MLDILAGKQIPVFLLTGFLGAGKTTLLNRLLDSGEISDTAILVNELADLGIDHLLIRQVNEHLVLLNAGCVCCSIREDLLQALRELFVDRLRGDATPFERVVIETSGLADPVPVVHTLLTDPFLRERYRLGGTITTIDASQSLAALCRHPEGLRQAAIADRFVVTKPDLADSAQLELLGAELAALNPDAAIGCNSEADIVELADFLKSGRQPAEGGAAGLRRAETSVATPPRAGADDTGDDGAAETAGSRASPGAHTGIVRSFVLRRVDPIRWDDFVAWIQQLLAHTPEGILRIKGIVDIEGEALPVVVQGVRHVFYPTASLPGWPAGPRQSRLVLILENPYGLSAGALLEATLPPSGAVRWTIDAAASKAPARHRIGDLGNIANTARHRRVGTRPE